MTLTCWGFLVGTPTLVFHNNGDRGPALSEPMGTLPLGTAPLLWRLPVCMPAGGKRIVRLVFSTAP